MRHYRIHPSVYSGTREWLLLPEVLGKFTVTYWSGTTIGTEIVSGYGTYHSFVHRSVDTYIVYTTSPGGQPRFRAFISKKRFIEPTTPIYTGDVYMDPIFSGTATIENWGWDNSDPSYYIFDWRYLYPPGHQYEGLPIWPTYTGSEITLHIYDKP